MLVDRRRALKLLGVGAVSPAVAAPIAPHSAEPSGQFQHGVASGDPTATGAILWTRITSQSGAQTLPVEWQVAEDPDLRRVVAGGVAEAGAARDFTVKVDVDHGLKPGTDYWYRFKARGEPSPIGRTRTLPQGPTERIVLAIVSCSRYERGLFNAYDAIARMEHVDAVVHLGDYIYEESGQHGPARYHEWAARMGRQLQPHGEIVTLADYRARHGLYKTDPDLQAVHARVPFICTWDDHEAVNDCWAGGADDHHPQIEGRWSDRKMAALRAYYEWMPIREPKPGRAFEAINRSFQFGDLASLVMLESRLVARAHQVSYHTDTPRGPGPDGVERPDMAVLRARLDDPARQMLGQRQEAWVANELKASVATGRTWQILGSQVVMGEVIAPDVKALLGPVFSEALMDVLPAHERERASQVADVFAYRAPYNLDAWDGYPAARERLYRACKDAGARPIVVSGDSHAFWANDLFDQSSEHVGVEFGATSVTSPGICDIVPLLPVNRLIEEANPDRVRFTDHGAKGFVRLTLQHDQATAELMAVSTVETRPYDLKVLKTYQVTPGGAGGVSPLQSS